MANSDKYKELEERVKLCNDPNTKMDWLASMVFMIARNDLASMEIKIKRIWKMLFVILIALLVSNQRAIDLIIDWIL